MIGAPQVLVHERPSREVVLHNSGSEAFDFAWDAVSAPLSVEPASGRVAAGACQTCRITFCLATAGALAGHRMTCRVLHGRTYIISLTGGNRQTDNRAVSRSPMQRRRLLPRHTHRTKQQCSLSQVTAGLYGLRLAVADSQEC